MVVIRKLSKSKYILAAVLTAGIFLLGMSLGLVIDDERLSFILEQEKTQELEYRSLYLLYEYIDQLGEQQECDILAQTFETGLDNLERSRIRLVDYSQDAKINKNEFEVLQREYLQSLINYWLLSQKVKTMCDLDMVPIVYFFSTDAECPDCASQEFVLTYMKKKFGQDLLTFPIDTTFEGEPMVQLFKRNYEILEYPTLIVDDKKLVGLQDKEALMKEVCAGFKIDHPECVGVEEQKSGIQIVNSYDEG